MEAVERFAELLATPDPRLDLALALVAAAGRPGVGPDRIVAELDQLATQVPDADAEQLCHALFDPGGAIGLQGDRVDYYDPRNSLLDEVLGRRLGIPITLSVVGIEVGRRVGIQLVGIGMPGHFLLGERTTGRFLDAFDGGRSVDAEGARALFHRMHGVDTTFEAAAYLAPTSATMIVMRVLNNLRGAHLRRGDRHGLATTLRLQAALPGSATAARRELAGVLAADGRFLEAAEVHESLARDDAGDAEQHARTATRLRARLN